MVPRVFSLKPLSLLNDSSLLKDGYQGVVKHHGTLSAPRKGARLLAEGHPVWYDDIP